MKLGRPPRSVEVRAPTQRLLHNAMALAQLHLAREEVLRTWADQSAILSARCQRWDECLNASEYCTHLSGSVSEVQDETVDRVFGHQVLLNTTCIAGHLLCTQTSPEGLLQLTAYKLVSLHRRSDGPASFVSCADGVSR